MIPCFYTIGTYPIIFFTQYGAKVLGQKLQMFTTILATIKCTYEMSYKARCMLFRSHKIQPLVTKKKSMSRQVRAYAFLSG